jgi:hypothetical protein
MGKNTVFKVNKVVKKNIDKAKIHTVDPVVIDTVKPVIKVVKHAVDPVINQNIDKNNKISCDQIKNMNESHKIKLKNCTNENFNIFD